MKLNIYIFLVVIVHMNFAFAQKYESQWVECRSGCSLVDPYFVEGVTFTWDGKCIKGKADGEGTAVKYEHGKLHSTYKGHYEAGVRKGYGKMIRHLSDEYWEGIFNDGQLTGRGKHLAYQQQMYYEGEFYNYLKQGRGTQYYGDNTYFTGLFNFLSSHYGCITDVKGNKQPKFENSISSIFVNNDLLFLHSKIKYSKKFYNKEWEEVPASEARYVRTFKSSSLHVPADTIITESIPGGIETEFIRLKDSTHLGNTEGKVFKASWFHKNGNIRASAKLDGNGKLLGPFLMFHDNAILASETFFTQNLSIIFTADYYPDGTIKRLYYAGDGKDSPETTIEIDGEGNGYIIKEHEFLKNKTFWTVGDAETKSYVSPDNYLVLEVPDNYPKFRGVRIPFNTDSDFTIECTVGKLEGESPKGFGMVFGHANWGNHYQFLLSGVGSFFIFGRKNDKDFNIINWKYAKSIRRQNQKNELKIIRRGSEFLYFINNLQVGTSQAYVFPGQGIGLIAAGKGIYSVQRLVIKEHLTPEKRETRLNELLAVRNGLDSKS